MASYEMSPAPGAKLTHLVELICFALVVANFVYLAAAYAQGSWLIAPDGSGILSDFVTVWGAGRLALTGHAAAVYDWPTLKAIEESAVGPFKGYLGWPYPPTFLLAATALSLLSYPGAFAVWLFGTFAAYLAAIRAIIGDRIGYFLAAAFPAVAANFMAGQNGFLSAALIGGTLACLETRPICAGILLGLLTYKPHLGLLFPIALVAGGNWRVIVSAAVVATLLAVLSWIAFGSATWNAFFPGIAQALAYDGAADWGKLQTPAGLVRALGGGETLAWTVQLTAALIAAAAIAALWKSRADYEIKAAALSTAVLVATPHLLTYDLVILAVPLAFLFRLGLSQGFASYELAGIGAASFLIFIFPFVLAPVGFAAVLVVTALVARRALMPRSASWSLAT